MTKVNTNIYALPCIKAITASKVNTGQTCDNIGLRKGGVCLGRFRVLGDRGDAAAQPNSTASGLLWVPAVSSDFQYNSVSFPLLLFLLSRKEKEGVI